VRSSTVFPAHLHRGRNLQYFPTRQQPAERVDHRGLIVIAPATGVGSADEAWTVSAMVGCLENSCRCGLATSYPRRPCTSPLLNAKAIAAL